VAEGAEGEGCRPQGLLLLRPIDTEPPGAGMSKREDDKSVAAEGCKPLKWDHTKIVDRIGYPGRPRKAAVGHCCTDNVLVLDRTAAEDKTASCKRSLYCRIDEVQQLQGQL